MEGWKDERMEGWNDGWMGGRERVWGKWTKGGR